MEIEQVKAHVKLSRPRFNSVIRIELRSRLIYMSLN